jgi:hypothetical protein
LRSSGKAVEGGLQAGRHLDSTTNKQPGSGSSMTISRAREGNVHANWVRAAMIRSSGSDGLNSKVSSVLRFLEAVEYISRAML